MPPTTITDPKVAITDILQSDWDDTKTMSLTPHITTGWWEEQRPTQPQVTATDPVEVSRVRYITGQGGGQLWDGQVTVNCWTTKNTLDASVPAVKLDSALARKLVWLMRVEVDRIIMVNQSLMSSVGYQFIRVDDRMEITDPSEPVTSFRQQLLVGYKWLESPA